MKEDLMRLIKCKNRKNNQCDPKLEGKESKSDTQEVPADCTGGREDSQFHIATEQTQTHLKAH